MTLPRLALVFTAALLVSMLALLPLRSALGLADLAAAGISARDVSGPVWSGHLHDARFRGNSLGDVDVGLKPLPLLLGRQHVRLASPTWRVTLLRGGRGGIEHASGSFTPGGLPTIHGASLLLQFDDASLVFTGGRCAMATGGVRVDAGFGEMASADLRPIQLQGSLQCTDGDGVLALASMPVPGAPQVAATMTIAADGNYQLQTRAHTDDAATALALQVAGFQQTPTGLVRVDSGNLLH